MYQWGYMVPLPEDAKKQKKHMECSESEKADQMRVTVPQKKTYKNSSTLNTLKWNIYVILNAKNIGKMCEMAFFAIISKVV